MTGCQRIVVSIACLLIIVSNAGADEKERPSQVTNPHRLLELAPFVRLPAVQDELKLTDTQIANVDFFVQEANRQFDRYKEDHRRQGRPDERGAVWPEFSIGRTLNRQVTDSVFSSDQLNRLKQLASQHVTRNPKGAFGILSPALKKELSVTDEQAKELREKSAVMDDQLKAREAELKLELEKLRTKLRAELVQTLEPAQRDSLKRLWGELVPIVP